MRYAVGLGMGFHARGSFYTYNATNNIQIDMYVVYYRT